jgi:hypothetical protein
MRARLRRAPQNDGRKSARHPANFAQARGLAGIGADETARPLMTFNEYAPLESSR